MHESRAEKKCNIEFQVMFDSYPTVFADKPCLGVI